MAEITVNISNIFQNMYGVTTGDRRKCFNQFLESTTFSGNEDELKSALQDLKPKSYLESKFKIEILIYFKRTRELMEILKEGEQVFIATIIKQEWFLRDILTKYNPEDFINEFILCLPCTAQRKILKRISYILNENAMDTIFDFILERYGPHVALSVLSGCSVEKIEEILKAYEVTLSFGQLKRMFNKNPNLIITYLNERKKFTKNTSKTSFDNRKLLIYIAQKNSTFFWQLCKNYNFNFVLGRRTTKKILNTHRSDVTSDPEKYIGFFRPDTLVRILHQDGELQQFFENVFPKNKTELEYPYNRALEILSYYRKHDQYNLFVKTFEKQFKESIMENINCLDDSFFYLDKIKDENTRETLAKIKYEKTHNVDYIQYYKLNNSVHLLKEVIVTSSTDKRCKLYQLLVKTCSVNKDLNALEEVFKYFCTIHLNEVAETGEKILTTVSDSFRNTIEHFTENHWMHINEILTVMRRNNEYCSGNKILKLKYIEYLYTNKKSIMAALINFLQDLQVFTYETLENVSLFKDPELKRKVLLMTSDMFPILRKWDENDTAYYFYRAQSLPLILKHNEQHPEHSISISDNEKILEIIRKSCKIYCMDSNVYEAIARMVCKVDRNNLENELMDLYFSFLLDKLPRYVKVINWYLKHDPLIIEKYVDCIMKEDLIYPYINWHLIRQYSHINLDKKFVKSFQKKLEEDDVKEKLESSTLNNENEAENSSYFIYLPSECLYPRANKSFKALKKNKPFSNSFYGLINEEGIKKKFHASFSERT